MRNDTLVASLIDSDTTLVLPGAPGTVSQTRREIAARNLTRAHDAYLMNWRARMRAALRVSPMTGDYVR